MVTSNNLPDKKVVKMPDQDCGMVVPQRTLLGEVNEHIACPLCRGYYIDATTIVECLHSFCRSCIIKHLQVKSYCPVCEMMINSAKPNIKLDKALQDIVYKLVPGLFQREMERRQNFYASRPGPAATATPEQRGEDTERIIFSPEDVISFSLEYTDATDTDSISSKSSDSNEPQPASVRRYLQCPADVNVNHLKKFLSMKYDIDSSQYAIDISYKRVPLPDYYTLMDIAYIYNWKRNEPMRFFYQIIDFIAMRNRLFDINRKGTHFQDRKSSPASNDDVSSPAPNLNEQGSEASSGTDSPMPEDNNSKQIVDTLKSHGKVTCPQDNLNDKILSPSFVKKNDDEVEKSQFLNSFELTAKSNSTPPKSSPVKSNIADNASAPNDTPTKSQAEPSKEEETLKRKATTPSNMPEMKKLKIEIEKTLLPDSSSPRSIMSAGPVRGSELTGKSKEESVSSKISHSTPAKMPQSFPTAPKDVKQQAPLVKPPDNPSIKRPMPAPQNTVSPKRKPNELNAPALHPTTNTQKTVSPLKLQIPKPEASKSTSRTSEVQKPTIKKIPDLKPSIPSSQVSQNKIQPPNKVRMDLLANNCDPTMDRSKILSLSMQNHGQPSGDHLKTLFDTCKINIPSSLSITLTDQKQDPRSLGEAGTEPKKNVVNKNLTGANTTSAHKVPSPPVHNYIEILKLPDTDTKKQNKQDGITDTKAPPQPNTNVNNNKTETVASQPKPNKTSEGSAKGPVPNLKPISDTKLAKQSSSATSGTPTPSPITFQQTFEKQLQTLQSDKKPKLPKNKAQVPKLVPANPKTFNAASKLNSPNNKPNPSGIPLMPPKDNKPSTALDLSSPGNIQGQLSAQQSRFETMQSISNLSKKQSLPPKAPTGSVPPSFPSITNRPLPSNVPLMLPSMSNINQFKQDRMPINASTAANISNSFRQEMAKLNQLKTLQSPSQSMPPSYQMPFHNTSSSTQPPPRQTRSPSSSPKLVIAEDKQIGNPEPNVNQSNQISSTQVSSMSSLPKSDSPKIHQTPGPSKPSLKPVKSMPPSLKSPGIRQPITPTVKPNPTPTDFQLYSAHHALVRHMEVNAWLKAQSQRFVSNMAHQAQNDFNKDNKQ